VTALAGRLFVALQHVLPQHAMSRLILALTRVRSPWLKRALIGGFLKLYTVDMQDALESDPHAYGSFNEFFTRALKADARPQAAEAGAIASPVDGTVSEIGAIEGDSLLQAKGRRYTLGELLAEQPWAARFAGGSFVTIYLAPFNYHRIHMPLSGDLKDTVYVPGRLFSVNGTTARQVPRLFARNERVLTRFAGSYGEFALVLVGALHVGSMATVWAGDITPAVRRRVTVLPPQPVTLAKGAELGRFNMGSTIILLLEAGRAEWRSDLKAGATVRLGQTLGRLLPP
jgi:phosphatidylserine decarboxylase